MNFDLLSSGAGYDQGITLYSRIGKTGIWQPCSPERNSGMNVSSTHEMLDEMRSIRCIEHKGKAKFITPFVGSQLDICKAFGFDVPQGCAPMYMSKKKAEKKRGRPKKQPPIRLES